MLYDELTDEYLLLVAAMMKLPANKKNLNFHSGENGILCYLSQHEDATPGQLQKHLQVGSGRIANALASLQSKGLVRRENATDDRRKVRVSITEEGRALNEERRREFYEHNKWVLGQMGEEDAKEYLRLLKLFIRINREFIEQQEKG